MSEDEGRGRIREGASSAQRTPTRPPEATKWAPLGEREARQEGPRSFRETADEQCRLRIARFELVQARMGYTETGDHARLVKAVDDFIAGSGESFPAALELRSIERSTRPDPRQVPLASELAGRLADAEHLLATADGLRAVYEPVARICKQALDALKAEEEAATAEPTG